MMHQTKPRNPLKIMGAFSTHNLQGAFEVFVRNNMQTDIPPLKIH